MTSKAGSGTPARTVPGSPPRRHHWWRWALAGAGALTVLAVAAVALFIKLQPDPPPLALPTARATAPAGPLRSTSAVGPGSVAGFPVQEPVLGFSNDLVGRTDAVTGTLTISGRRDGPELQAAGSIPVAFSGWGIKGPGGFGPFGSLANHGIAEFRLILYRATTSRPTPP